MELLHDPGARAPAVHTAAAGALFQLGACGEELEHDTTANKATSR